jgi:signal peptidase I
MTDHVQPSRAEALAESTELVVDDVDGDGDDQDTDAGTSTARRRARGLIDWIVVIGVALLVAFLVRTFVLAHFVVDGHSMDTTLHDGDRVFVNKLSYRLHEPNRGDVVVLHEINGASERDLIKRVIALEGETIEVRNCVVLIDGMELLEPYLDPQVVTPGNCGGDYGPTDVPDDHVFVMGDNRAGSQDSRSENVGPIDEDEIVGRAFVVFWPTSHWRWL